MLPLEYCGPQKRSFAVGRHAEAISLKAISSEAISGIVKLVVLKGTCISSEAISGF